MDHIENDHYYIDNVCEDENHTFPQIGYLLACPRCGRKILVSATLNGTNHNLSVGAGCGECFAKNPDAEFALAHPQVCEKIRSWVAKDEDT